MSNARCQRQQTGFSLAELMIVVFIIAIASGFLLLRAGNFTYGKSARDLARQLVAFCQVVQQQAILQPAILGLRLSDQGYAVYAYRQTTRDWQSLAERDKFWQAQVFPRHLSVNLTLGQPGLTLPGEAGSQAPQIIFSPSGEITPFVLLLKQAGQEQSYQVSANIAGEISTNAD